MMFIDGRAHAGGPHVFDDPHSSRKGMASGKKTFENQDIMYHEFSKEEAWESRWTVEKLAAVNDFYMECHLESTWKKSVPCKGMFDPYHTMTNLNASAKKSKLADILAEYYNAIDAITVPMSDRGGSTHFQHALPHIAELSCNLAYLHPFADSNSRTRNMVLQTELVRQGGHPAVLWDNYWGIYHAADWNISGCQSEKLEVFVLDGWCGWESTYNTNASPFSPFAEVNGTLLSTPHSEYNAGTGACEVGPKRDDWVEPFDKNHQS
jgi:hypothetical protein